MALEAQAIFCGGFRRWKKFPIPKIGSPSIPENTKILLLRQPRDIISLKSNGSDGFRKPYRMILDDNYVNDENNEAKDVTDSCGLLPEYVENSRKSQEKEIIFGRLAMVVLAATTTVEIATGTTLFEKIDFDDVTNLEEVCLAAITFSALFTYSPTARNRAGTILNLTINTFMELFIDNLIQLFLEDELSDEFDDL